MNPELQRNLWLEASPFRLVLIAGLVLLAFAAASVAPRGIGSTSTVALALYWFFAVLWGTRSAALSVVAEIRERTWDGQKLSSIGPWEMVWGKLFGATSANWFGALLCLPFILLPAIRATNDLGTRRSDSTIKKLLQPEIIWLFLRARPRTINFAWISIIV